MSSTAEPRLHPSWLAALGPEFPKQYMADLRAFLKGEVAAHGKRIHPLPGQFFAALDSTPLTQVKAVIIGQDPYHGPGQAHGLSFSVQEGVRSPPSLQNILKELAADIGASPAPHGCLASWAGQGVLMLNSVLSVREKEPGSHAGKGWEQFTDAVVQAVSARPGRVAFVLWGAYAQKKAASVDRTRHLVIASPHPSPYSANNGFFGSRPFSKVNAFLAETGQDPVDWQIA